MKSVQDILCNLIQIRTDSSQESNAAFVDYLVHVFNQNNIVFEKIPNSDGKLVNIFAGINVSNLQDIRGGIVLSGHMDTVPVDFNAWKTNPFHGIQQNGKIYGCGSVDMKQFIAVCLYLLPQLKKINTPVFLAFSSDEETNVFGVQEIVRFLSQKNIRPKYALIGEATDFKLCPCNRGYAGYQTIIKGAAGHAGKPDLGTNAIYIGAKIANQIEKLNQFYASKGTTLNLGMVQGGTGRNSIPGQMVLDWEIRYQNESDKNQILELMNSFFQDLETKYKKSEILSEPKEMIPAFEKKEDSYLIQVAQSILRTKMIDYPYASEAGFFQSFEMDTLICGCGNMTLPHTANEYILVEDMERYAEFLIQLVNKL